MQGGRLSLLNNAAVGTRRRVRLAGAVAAATLLADQLSKSWAVAVLSDRDIDLLGSLRLHLVANSGASFSLGRGRGGIIGALALVVVAGIVATSRHLTDRRGALAIGLIVGGALGNLLDRIFRDGSGGFLGGSVVDFIDLQWWPVFNVADMAISCGGVVLVLLAFRAER